VVVPLQKPPSPGFWGAVLWCLLYLAVLTSIQVAVMGVVLATRIVTAPDGKQLLQKLQEGKSQPTEVLGAGFGASLLATEVVGIALAWVITRLVVGKRWPRRLALRRPGVLHIILVILFCPALIYVSTGIHQIAEAALDQYHLTFHYNSELQKNFVEWPIWFGVLVVGLGPALSEELFCRGFLGRGLLGRYGTLGGVLLTSLFFGLLHLDPPHVVATFVMGCCLHFTYLMTRSLWMPMLLHFLNNSSAVVLATQSGNVDQGAEADKAIGPVPFVAALILGAAVGWALYRSRVRFASIDDRGPRFWQPDFPSVEYPPANSHFQPIHSWPGWLASSAIVVASAGFGAAVYMSGGATP